MAKPSSAEDELGQLLDRDKGSIADTLDDLAVAVVSGGSEAAATRKLGQLLVRSEALADLLGRRRMLLQADAVSGPRTFQEDPQPPSAVPVVPNVPFQEAIDALLSREPRLAPGWQEAQRVYTEERGFSLARSASETLTARVQLTLARLMDKGATLAEAEQAIQKDATEHTGDVFAFSRGYAETVYRTNMAQAYSAGRLRQARDPAVRAAVPGFRYDAVLDGDARENHEAADGFVALADDPAWDRLTPPLGFNCRCSIAPATRAELQRAGVIDEEGRTFQARPPAGAGADPGFTILGRPDRLLYGGA